MSNLHYLAKRRQKKEQQRFNAVQDLTCLAYEKLLVTLTRSGNTISDQHREALMEMLGMYSFIAAGKETGRWAFDLSVGGAKTQSVVAWCAALSDLQRISAPGAWWKRSDISVLITAAKVEALADTKRDLIASGVPADRIGLWHSYDFKSEYAMAARRGQAPKDHASEPSIDNPQALTTKQFCLVAHNRLRGNDLAKWYIYTDPVTGQELPRSVTFHDEAMITSDVFAVSAVELESATLALRPYVKHLPETAPVRLALSYIEKCLAVLDQDVAEQDAWFKKFSTHRPAMSVVLPDLETHTTPELDENGQETGRILTIGSIEQYIKAIQVQNRNGYTSRLVNFLKVADKPLRVLRSSGGAFFHYQLGIPAELENVVVLDASYGIRMLEKLDKTIKTRPSFDGRVADYSAVEAHFLKYNSGRGKMEQSFEKPWKTSRLISREVAEVVKGIPTNEGVLIFVFKQHGDRVNIQDQLVSDLIAEGIDPTSELDVLDIKTGEQRREKRIQFLTWGNETSLSEFCWCSNLIFAGVLQKPPHVLEALSHGQKGGQLETADEDEVSQVHLTEVATLIHQAAGRGSMRIIRDGKASPMRLWFMHWNSKVKKYIRQVLPGVRISRWKSQYVDPMSAIIDDAAEKIVAALHSLPEEQDSISLKALKALAGYGPVEEGLKPIAPQTWRDARDAAIDYLDDAWYVDGGQMKRQSNVFP